MDERHLVTVRESASLDVMASGARLVVRIGGQSFVTGSEAFKKAAEVAKLVADLKEVGLGEDDIQLESVSTEVESGLLLKTSSATYHLRIDCKSLDLLGRVLSAISSQKNARVFEIAWQYPDLNTTKKQLLRSAVQAAKETARTIADSLAVKLLGVHKLGYEVTGLGTDVRLSEPRGFGGRARKTKAMALDHLDLSHTTTLKIAVQAEFMVDTFTPDAT